MANVIARSLVDGSKAPPWIAWSRSRRARAIAGASAAARGVGTTPRPLRTSSGSPSAARKRARALLTAEGVTCRRRAARATLRSPSTLSSTRSRFKSSADKLTAGDDTHHEASLAEINRRRRVVSMTRTVIGHVTHFALAALVAGGCATQDTRSTAMSDRLRDQNKHDVARLFDIFNQGDLAAIDELVGPDYVGAQGGKGPEGFKAVVVGLRTSFPDLHYTINDVLAEGDQVAVRWRWTGTYRAPFRGFAATGKT